MKKSFTANEIDKSVARLVRGFDISPLLPHLELVGIGQVQEIKDATGQANRYYQWLHCLMKVLKPKQVIELGAAAGISTIMMATALPDSAQIYAVDINSNAFGWMKHDYPNVTKIFGDDLDMGIWEGVNLLETDVWFIDTIHDGEQLRKELELYKPFFKKGTVVALDDIHINTGMNQVWEELEYDKCDTTNPNHYSGFGFFLV